MRRPVKQAPVMSWDMAEMGRVLHDFYTHQNTHQKVHKMNQMSEKSPNGMGGERGIPRRKTRRRR